MMRATDCWQTAFDEVVTEGAGTRGQKRIVMMTQLFFLVLVCYGLMLADGQPCFVPNTTTLGDVNSKEFTGQVKFCFDNDWGAVCAFNSLNNFNTPASQVVCYELGYSGQGATYVKGSNTVSGGMVWLGNVRCQGYEEKLNDCRKDIYHDKTPKGCRSDPASVYVTCPKESQVRLHNYRDDKLRDYRGIVEHWYDGSWHVLCDTGEWTWNDSQVVCQQLGLGNAVQLGPFKTDDGSLGYLQNSIDCQNDEPMIRNCRYEDKWDVSSTCGGTHASAKCEGPVVQDITIISRTQTSITFSWKLPPNFFYYNPVVVTEFHVEYWPKGHPSEMRSFNRPSVFDNATMDDLDPDTTYELMIVAMMGEHHGPNSSVWSVKTIERPVDAAIVVLSCALTAVSCIVIVILSGAMIRCIIIRRRRRHGYQNIQNENRGCFYNIMFCYYCVREHGVILNDEQEQRAILNGEQEQRAILNGEQEQRAILNGEQEQRAILNGEQERRAILNDEQERRAILNGEQERPVIVDGEEYFNAPD